MALAGRCRLAHEQHQVPVEWEAQMASRLVPGDEAEQVQVEPRRNHVGRHRTREELLHVLRHDDASVGAPRDPARRKLQQPAGDRDPEVLPYDALQIVSAKRHDERQPLG